MASQFSITQAAKLAGVSKRQADYWARTGLVTPARTDAPGARRRRYTFRDLVALGTVAELRRLGCPLQKIRAAVRTLKAHFRQESDADVLARRVLLTDGKRVYLAETAAGAWDILSKQRVWPVHLGLLIGELRQRVDALPLPWTEAVSVRGRNYHLRITRDTEQGGYWVQCKELPEALSQGDTREEAVANGRDALETVLDFLAAQQRALAGAKHVKAG